MHRKALGRGLDALIPGANTSSTGPGVGLAEEHADQPGLREVPIEEISPNPHQPRTRFDDDAIRELAASIRATGVLQPVILRRSDEIGFQLVAGERRLRAAQFAGLSTIPAIVRDVSDREMMELALVENV